MFLPSSVADLGSLYFKLTVRRRKLLECLYRLYKKFPKVFPSMKLLVKSSGLSERAIQYFLNSKTSLRFLFFEIQSTFIRGRQTTNTYVLNKDFIMAMDWLIIHGSHRAPKNKHDAIISSMRNATKLHPPYTSKLHPSYKDSSYKDIKSSFNPYLQKIGIRFDQKVFIHANFSDSEIVQAIQIAIMANRNKKIEGDVGYYVIGICKKLKDKQLNL